MPNKGTLYEPSPETISYELAIGENEALYSAVVEGLQQLAANKQYDRKVYRSYANVKIRRILDKWTLCIRGQWNWALPERGFWCDWRAGYRTDNINWCALAFAFEEQVPEFYAMKDDGDPEKEYYE